MKNSIAYWKSNIKYWWVFLITGILLFLTGCVIIRYPVSSYISIAMLVSLLLVVVGIGHIWFASTNNKNLPYWGWHLFIGILDIVLGIILFLYPNITMAVLPLLVGFLFFIRSVSLISYAFALRRSDRGWGWLLTGGILTLLLGLLVIYYPFFGCFTVIVWTAAAFFVAAVFNIVLAFRLKSKKDEIGSALT